jgi:hypothetical protein
MDKFPVTNSQFLQFVEAEGYKKSHFWSEKTWKWREENKINFPHFWTWNSIENCFYVQTLFGDKFPIQVTRYEKVSRFFLASSRLAGFLLQCGGDCVCQVGGEATSVGGRVAESCVWIGGEKISVGQLRSCSGNSRKFQFIFVCSGSYCKIFWVICDNE